ncbi:twin-arginine translocase TatA/TatE family subunit [Okibacterium fritillariae]|uniref:twin-arginine translocase TatA/TatE family subunit n=1 Tax=Okibacterium fritillariae TaxID=123320 RepID=UPI0040554309
MGIFGNLTGWHLLAIVFLVLLLFGAPKLPGLAKSVGQSLKIFKNEVKSDKVDGDHAAAADAQVPTQQPTAQQAPVQQAPAQQPVAQPYVAPQAPQAEPAPVLSAPPVQPAPHGEATSAGAQNAESHQKN